MNLVMKFKEKRNSRMRENDARKHKLLELLIQNEELKKTILETQNDECYVQKNELRNIKEIYKEQNVICKNLMKKTEEISKENQELKNRLFNLQLKLPSSFPVKTIMEYCASQAWLGNKAERIFIASDKKTKIIFSGIVYEPGYEDTCKNF